MATTTGCQSALRNTAVDIAERLEGIAWALDRIFEPADPGSDSEAMAALGFLLANQLRADSVALRAFEHAGAGGEEAKG
jgi:hypothetical protein